MQGFKVLLIDDDILCLNSMARAFKLFGLDVDYFSSPEQACKAYEAAQHSVVITDVRMKDMDGFSVLKKVKSINNETKVIFITGFKDKRIREAINHGVEEVYEKPVAIKEIVLRLNESFRNINTYKKNNCLAETDKLSFESKIVFENLKKVINNLNEITNNLNNWKRTKFWDKYLSYFNIISLLNKKSAILLNEIFDVISLDFYKVRLKKQRLDINSFLNGINQILRYQAYDKHLTLKFQLCEEDLLCMIDRDKFFQVILNLYQNSIKYSNDFGHITIISRKALYNNRQYVCIEIVDDGIGIKRDKLPYLFKKYSKAGRIGICFEKSTGLDLYIVKKIVELHKGIVKVKSEEDIGTRFSIYLQSVV